jgi:hypothetical protein
MKLLVRAPNVQKCDALHRPGAAAVQGIFSRLIHVAPVRFDDKQRFPNSQTYTFV